jgi:ABC-type uncharacterized transport system involved in gliding motility auxiliary subunit
LSPTGGDSEVNRLGKFSLILSALCLVFTLGIKVALSGWMPFMSFGLGFALLFFIVALLLNIGFLKVLFKSESMHFLVKSLLVILVSFVLLFSMNYIVLKQGWFVDITHNKINSLQPLTVSLLRALPEKAQFFYFHVGNEHVKGFEAIVRDEVKRYQEINDRIEFYSHSVFQRPDLAKEFKVGDEPSTLFLRYKGRIQRVSDLEESEFLNAFLKLTKPAKKIYFLHSHQARQIDDETTFGLITIKQQLERLHYQVESLPELSELPKDIVLLVWVGPKEPLTPAEAQILDDYLKQGGALFLALDPGETVGFDSILGNYALQFENNFIFDGQAPAGQSPLLAIVHPGQSNHQVSRSLNEGDNGFFFVASALKILESSTEGQRVSPLLEYLPTAKAHSDISAESPVVGQGRQIAAAISEGVKGQDFYRLAVVGDSDFMTNQFSQQPGTFDFIMSLFSYLSKDEDLLKMRPQLPDATPLTLTQTQLNLYFLFFILPFAIMFFIIALFFKLRRYF